MKLRPNRLMLSFALLSCLLAGCKPANQTDDSEKPVIQSTPSARDAQQVPPGMPEIKITGEVFLVLESRETLKLSLTEVQIISDAQARDFFSKNPSLTVNAETWPEQARDLVKSIRAMAVQIDQMRAADAEVQARRSEYNAKFNQLLADKKATQYIVSNRRASQAYDEVQKKIEDHIAKRYDTTPPIDTTHLSDVTTARERSRELEKQVYAGLLTAVVDRTLSDSEGRFAFKLNVAHGAPHFLLARVARRVADQEEMLLWLTPLSDEAEQKILLSNHNLLRW